MNADRLAKRIDDLEGNSLDQAVFYIEDVRGLLDLYKQEKEKNKDMKDAVKYLKKIEPEKLKLIVDSWNENIGNKIEQEWISKDKIKTRMEQTKKVYEEEMKPYWIEVGDGERVLNVTYLSKKEKEELINKRNCLLVQIKTYEELLEEKNEI